MKLKRTHIITLANQKGGCGKTTSTVSLASALAEEGLSVAIADADPQCNSTDTFGIDRDELLRDGHYTMADAYLAKRPAREIAYPLEEGRFKGELVVIPGNRALGSVPHRLDAQLQATVANDDYSDLDADDIKNEHRHRLKASLDSLRGHKDVVLIDTPPDLAFLLTSALIASDWFIIPVFPSGYDLQGLETLLKTTEKARERFNPKLKLLGVLIGNFDTRTRLDEDIRNTLTRKFGPDIVFPTVVHRSVKHREAVVYKQSIFEHAPGQQPAEQFAALAREVLKRIEKPQISTDGDMQSDMEVVGGN